MVWQPNGTNAISEEEPRCGTQRPTMKTNPLLAKADLGKVKKCIFNEPSADHVFGYPNPKDPEGAREVTMIWKEHTPSNNQKNAATPDFKTMNKLAVQNGLSTAKDLPAFRQSHKVTVKPFDHTAKQAPKLPSDKDTTFTYGMPSAHRPAEVVRQCGPQEPPVKYLIQGAYQEEWVQSTAQTDHPVDHKPYIPPVPTRAVLGHSMGASQYLQPHSNEEAWKLSKFQKVGPKVTQYMRKPAEGAA